MNAPAFEDQGSGIRDQGSGIRDQASTRHHLSGFFYVLFVALSLLAAVKPAHAGGTIPRTQNYYAAAPCFTPQAPLSSVLACRVNYIQAWYGSLYTVALVSYNLPPPTGSSVGNMYLSIKRKSNGTVTYTTQGLYRGSLPCPANSTGTTSCTCDTGYQPDTAGTSCVPVPVATCSVDDLPAITDPEVQAFEDNPDLSDTARLTPRMQTALSCLLTAAVDGSPSVGSAYRPPAYNQHLIDVWEKWVNELLENEDSACAVRKTEIQSHFQRHRLKESQGPVPGSLHTLGEAVDVTISLPSANINALATGCQLRRPLPVKDNVHFIHQ
jgi:hypothetical protein